jgi:hypothetical protein
MSDETLIPEDTIHSGDTTDPETGATVSPDGSNIEFPGDTVYPSDSPAQKRIDDELKDLVPDVPPASDPDDSSS